PRLRARAARQAHRAGEGRTRLPAHGQPLQPRALREAGDRSGRREAPALITPTRRRGPDGRQRGPKRLPPRRRRALPHPLTLLLSEGPGPHRDPRLGDPIYPRTPAALFALAGLAAAASAQCPPAPPQSLSASQGLYCSSVFLDWQD